MASHCALVADANVIGGGMELRMVMNREVVERVRSSDCDVVLNLTAGVGGDFAPSDDDPARGGPGTDMVGPAERLVHVEELRPEICRLDCDSLNFGDATYISTASQLREMANGIRDCGVKPELECFEMGHVRQATALVEAGLVDDPPFYQLALGARTLTPDEARKRLGLRRPRGPQMTSAASP